MPTKARCWNVHGPHGDEANAPISAWFDVWSENGELLLRHWPFQKANANNVLPPPRASTLSFTTVELERGLFVRVMDGPVQVEGRPVLIRVFRDENWKECGARLEKSSKYQRSGSPLAVALAAIGGYLIATRFIATTRRHGAAGTPDYFGNRSRKRLPNPNPDDELGRLATVFNDTLARLEASFAELQRFTAGRVA